MHLLLSVEWQNLEVPLSCLGSRESGVGLSSIMEQRLGAGQI